MTSTSKHNTKCLLRRIVQSLTCMTTDACLSADPGKASLISLRSHSFVEIDHKIFSMAILLLSTVSRRVVVSYKHKYMHEVLVKGLVKPAQKKVWVGELTAQT